jgi:hypothetical protein
MMLSHETPHGKGGCDSTVRHYEERYKAWPGSPNRLRAFQAWLNIDIGIHLPHTPQPSQHA